MRTYLSETLLEKFKNETKMNNYIKNKLIIFKFTKFIFYIFLIFQKYLKLTRIKKNSNLIFIIKIWIKLFITIIFKYKYKFIEIKKHIFRLIFKLFNMNGFKKWVRSGNNY